MVTNPGVNGDCFFSAAPDRPEHLREQQVCSALNLSKENER
jgi:hypothetical protein